MDEKERFIKELDQRTKLWERKRDGAKKRVELGKPLAERELDIAENALERIAKKRDELLGVKKLDVEYPALEVVLRKEKELMEKAPKKRVHKKPKALFELAPAKDVEEEGEKDE